MAARRTGPHRIWPLTATRESSPSCSAAARAGSPAPATARTTASRIPSPINGNILASELAAAGLGAGPGDARHHADPGHSVRRRRRRRLFPLEGLAVLPGRPDAVALERAHRRRRRPISESSAEAVLRILARRADVAQGLRLRTGPADARQFRLSSGTRARTSGGMDAEKHQQSGLPWAIPQSFEPPHSGQEAAPSMPLPVQHARKDQRRDDRGVGFDDELRRVRRRACPR